MFCRNSYIKFQKSPLESVSQVIMVHALATEKIWFDKSKVEEAESNFYIRKYSGASAVPAVRKLYLSFHG